jgi:hypothetical protein
VWRGGRRVCEEEGVCENAEEAPLLFVVLSVVVLCGRDLLRGMAAFKAKRRSET